jgi:hypothetical protein
MAKQFYFCFIRPEDISPKKYDRCPHVQLQTVVWLFLWRFWSSVFFLAERPFRLCRYRTHFTVNIDTFVSVSSSIFTRSFCCCSGIDLHFSHQSTFISRKTERVSFLNGTTAAWSLHLLLCSSLFCQRWSLVVLVQHWQLCWHDNWVRILNLSIGSCVKSVCFDWLLLATSCTKLKRFIGCRWVAYAGGCFTKQSRSNSFAKQLKTACKLHRLTTALVKSSAR